jgi:HEPN domain-containing protein
MRASAADEAGRWLRQAENDLAFARVAVREGFHAQACFVAQQTAEKAAKAIAYGLGERLVIGHSIVELVERLRERVESLAALREAAGVLDQYYVPTRYPNGLPGGVPFEAFGPTQATRAVEDAARFVEAARDVLRAAG